MSVTVSRFEFDSFLVPALTQVGDVTEKQRLAARLLGKIEAHEGVELEALDPERVRQAEADGTALFAEPSLAQARVSFDFTEEERMLLVRRLNALIPTLNLYGARTALELIDRLEEPDA